MTDTTIAQIQAKLESRTGRDYLALSDLMEFDHVIQVHEDGRVTDAPGVYGPERLEHSEGENGKVDPYGMLGDWTLMNGYSGQDRYSGPIMHNSEFIGGGMAEDILAEPGYYVSLVCYWPDGEDSDEDETYVEGWAVARLDT